MRIKVFEVSVLPVRTLVNNLKALVCICLSVWYTVRELRESRLFLLLHGNTSTSSRVGALSKEI